MNKAQQMIQKIKAIVDEYDGEDDLRDVIARTVDGATELHTNSEVARIAGVGEHNPKGLNPSEIQTLCGAVLRHIEREKTGR